MQALANDGNQCRAESLEVHRWCFCAGQSVALPRLQRLVLVDCRFETGPRDVTDSNYAPGSAGLVAVFGLQPAALRTLHVQCCIAAGAGFSQPGAQLSAGLAAFSRLTSLSFAGSDFVSDAVATEAGALPALAHLDLSTPHACSRRLPLWPRLSPAAPAALASRGGLRSSLRSLTLRGQADIGDSGAAAISALTALTRLDVALPQTGWDVGLGDAGAQALGRGLTGLQVLRLGECWFAQRGCAVIGRLTRLTGAPPHR